MQTLKKYSVHIKSISPLVMGNDIAANPLHPTAKRLKEITCLKTKQDEHHLAIAKLQWESSLYYDEQIGVYLSSRMIMGCLKASARKEKKGLQLKAVIIDCYPGTPLIPYEKMSQEKLWAEKNKKGEQIYVHSELVTTQQSKVLRTRPIFHRWEAKFELFLNIEILSEKDFKRILERAGFEYGLGELRPQLVTGTCGRFEVVEMKEI